MLVEFPMPSKTILSFPTTAGQRGEDFHHRRVWWVLLWRGRSSRDNVMNWLQVLFSVPPEVLQGGDWDSRIELGPGMRRDGEKVFSRFVLLLVIPLIWLVMDSVNIPQGGSVLLIMVIDECPSLSYLYLQAFITLFCSGNLFLLQAMVCFTMLHHGLQGNLSSGACCTSSSFSSLSSGSGICRGVSHIYSCFFLATITVPQ